MFTAFVTAYLIDNIEFICLLINILQSLKEMRQDKVIKCKTVTKRQKMPKEIINIVEYFLWLGHYSGNKKPRSISTSTFNVALLTSTLLITVCLDANIPVPLSMFV